ncbi:cytochrome P450 [Dactylosporangium fulvum]|uniref:Cytochrome P450 n=1 Tax=Dactylosporangium fulvum TaxID=53359 RepID=A0ABY5VVM9_9ACTN|nr:cytochrome P450 [Dactylosporangium fulvum]UWP81204.1 cytochrome P450 [Dactylosporangium fulvum]
MTAAELFDPWSREFVARPYPAYAWLREHEPVSWFEPSRQYLVSRHEDVNALLRDRRLGRSYLHVFSHAEMDRPEPPAYQEPFWHLNNNGMLDREPPDHTRLRRLVSQAFTPRRVEALRPVVQRLADGLVDAFVKNGGGDLIAEVAEPLPVTVIAELLGIPEADRHNLRPWSAAMCGMYELNPSREAADAAVRASEEFSDYLRALARARKADPQDDLVSALAAVDGLSEDELIGTCVLLLNAGHEATVNVTGNGWWALLRNPDQLELLRANRDLLPGAIEELMRYDTPLQMFERWVLEDIEVHGVPIPRGSEVALLFGSANHDPAVFGDPERLDLRRKENPHISFGAGIHYCLGAPLARIELAASFGAMLDKAPGLRLAQEPEWKPGYVIRGLERLEVSL